MMGCFIVIIVGLIVSHITGVNEPKDVNPKLISPIVQNYFYKKDMIPGKEMYEVVKTSEKQADVQEYQLKQRT